jgi:hypothetical protein
MKYFMFVLFVAVALVGLNSSALAQGYTSAVTTLHFTVAHPLEIIGGDITFDGLTQGQCYIFTADGYVQPATEGQAAGSQVLNVFFTYGDVNPGDLVQWDFMLPAYALGATGGGRIALSDWTYGYDPTALGTGQFTEQGPIAGPVVLPAISGGTISMGFKACVPAGALGGGESYDAQMVAEAHYLVQL